MKGCIFCNGKVEFDKLTQQYDCKDCGDSFTKEEADFSFKGGKGKQKQKRMKREF